MSQVHPLARTTPRVRTEIKNSNAGATALAEIYNISVATARKWKSRVMYWIVPTGPTT